MERFSRVVGFSAWEIGAIGMNITQPSGEKVFVDLRREDAPLLIDQLIAACCEFDDLESLCKQHDEAVLALP